MITKTSLFTVKKINLVIICAFTYTLAFTQEVENTVDLNSQHWYHGSKNCKENTNPPIQVVQYNSNTGNELLKYTNYLHQKETANAAKTIDEFLVKYYIKRDLYDFVYAQFSSFYYLEKTEEALNYIKTDHPIYLSDTLSTVPDQNISYLVPIAAILKHSGDLEQARHLTNLLGDFLRSKFEYH